MFYHVLERYVPDPGIGMPLEVDVVIPGDRHYFLIESRGQWYVVVEADYLTLDDFTIDEIEESFPVKVKGWCVRNEHQDKLKTSLAPTDWFTAPGAREDGRLDRESKYVTYEEHLRAYALLRVAPVGGISEKDLGLSFFNGIGQKSSSP